MNRLTFDTESKLNDLLINVFNAYRHGLQRQPVAEPQIRPRGFDALKFLGTIGWIPLEQRWKLDKLHSACSKGLFATRDGRLEAALTHYGRAKENLDLLEEGTRPAWWLGVSTYEAGYAYLAFRRGDAQQARSLLDRAMDADLELERAGLPVMVMHRIQQGHNLSRMEMRLGRRAAAVELAGKLLAYLERRVDTLPFHQNWGFRSLQAVPRSLIRSMIHQIVAETAGYIVTGNAPAEEWQGLIEASRLCCNPDTAISPQVQLALHAQYERLLDEPGSYLRNLERFFGLGIRHCHLLWYAVLIELVDFCHDIDTRHSRQVKDVILRDSAKWKGLPPFLRERIDVSAARRSAA